ncbi:dnaJ homolog subfamily C member 2-like [Stegodyphus dumicola]|uniref:dnaJ homolog subfamily C member 2-like n=1 Tax=Stegodyphus dumicola TaxID=202533 RepID=UPI0015B1E5B4|nr:dnaJ homolog subfamily C member 2-like [Stegodyphus dumicola]
MKPEGQQKFKNVRIQIWTNMQSFNEISPSSHSTRISPGPCDDTSNMMRSLLSTSVRSIKHPSITLLVESLWKFRRYVVLRCTCYTSTIYQLIKIISTYANTVLNERNILIFQKRQEALEAERKQKEKEEEEAKLKREKEKKEKEAIKKQQKKEKKLLQQICEQNNYFAADEEEKISHLKEVDKLCNLLSLQQLQNLNVALQKEDQIIKKNVFMKEVESLNKHLEMEKEQLFASSQRSTSNSAEKTNSQKPWSPDDLQLLVKGVNLFPAGTNNRWDVIVAFMAQHSTSKVKRTAKEVLAKAKELQKRSGGLREQINKNAYENLEKNQKQVPIAVKDQSAPTERFDAVNESSNSVPAAWTADEQQLLEQALKTYPINTEDRWEKIAACIPGRDKKDCIKRYKDLVEMVKAKKAAQATASQKQKK